MNKRVTIVLIVFLLLALALYFVPWPRCIEFRSTCVEVDRQGNILSDEGEIIFEGTYYHYLFQRDTFQLTHLELPSVEVISTIEYSNGPPCVLDSPKGYDFIWTVCSFEAPNPSATSRKTETKFAAFFTHPDFSYLVFEYSDNNQESIPARYFVTTGEDDPNPVDMLKEFCLYLEKQPN